MLRRRSTLADRERWTATAANGKLRLRHLGKGGAMGSKGNRAYLSQFMFECRCGALVWYLAALRDASMRSTPVLRRHAGCANLGCGCSTSRKFKRGDFLQKQERWKGLLDRGERVLIHKPERADDEVLWLVAEATPTV